MGTDSAAFGEATAAVVHHLKWMADCRDAELRNPALHPAAAKVMLSLRKHWHGLIVFVAHPEIALNNNAAENAVRGPVVGRKNYYGSGSREVESLKALLRAPAKRYVARICKPSF